MANSKIPSDVELLEALTTFRTQTEVAEYFGCARSTVCERIKHPRFLKLLHAQYAATYRHMAANVEGDLSEALAALRGSLTDRDGNVRMQAVRLMLEVCNSLERAMAVEADVEQPTKAGAFELLNRIKSASKLSRTDVPVERPEDAPEPVERNV